MTLLAKYEQAISSGEIEDSALQRDILKQMQVLVEDLKKPQRSWFGWRVNQQIKGLYIYGPVGAGKTYLVDMFYDYVPEERKARFHFHHFMQQIDKRLRQFQGQKDPLKKIAQDLSQQTRLLCFDEFLVNDVAYAMILAELLQELISSGVILVISSNTKPDDLYLNGVQRDRFLPAIALINQHCEVLLLNEQRDHRLGRETMIHAYLYPLNQDTEQVMENQFEQFGTHIQTHGLIRIENRDVPYIKRNTRAIWFDFDVLCNLPRSQLDYLELADQFDSVFLSHVPVLGAQHTAQTIMFVYFIDVMYDRGVKVVISAAVPIESLYLEGEMKETFKRTQSRLMEMKSVDYLHRHPRRKEELIQ